MADITTDDFYPSVTLDPRSPDGNVAPLFGVPVWASSDATVLSVAASADGMSAQVMTVAPGTARVSVVAEADPTPGAHTITGVSEDVNVALGASAEASVLTLVLGAASPKNPAPAPTP